MKQDTAKKGLLRTLFTLFLAIQMLLPAFAAETVLSDEEEAFSEEELNEILDLYLNGGEDEEEKEPFSQSILDPELQMEYAGKERIRYLLPNSSSFTSTVPNGMITEQSVTIELPEGTVGMVQKNDGNSSLIENTRFSEPGAYHLTFFFFQSSPTQEDYNVYEVNFYFTITGERNAQVGVISAPEGFEICEVIKDGVPQKGIHSNFYFLKQDAVYKIRYQDKKTGLIHLESNLIRDTTAPFLLFSEDISQGAVSGPLEFSVSEAGSSIIATYNGHRGELAIHTLTAAGHYELEVSDPAGNSRIYHFQLRQTYELIDTKVIILAFLFLTGLLLRLWFLRKNMRVI